MLEGGKHGDLEFLMQHLTFEICCRYWKVDKRAISHKVTHFAAIPHMAICSGRLQGIAHL
jgi:hypothetical protein